jgi:hypothetical protein
VRAALAIKHEAGDRHEINAEAQSRKAEERRENFNWGLTTNEGCGLGKPQKHF